MSEADLSSGGAGTGAGKGNSAWAHLRPLPPTAFRSGAGKPDTVAVTAGAAEVGTSGAAAAAGGARQAEQARSVSSSSCAGYFGSSEGPKEKEVGSGGAAAVAARKYELGSDASGETASASGAGGAGDGAGAKASMVNVDRDLQSKINAFTNAQKVCAPYIHRASFVLLFVTGTGGEGRGAQAFKSSSMTCRLL